jgi:hypothetical protein
MSEYAAKLMEVLDIGTGSLKDDPRVRRASSGALRAVPNQDSETGSLKCKVQPPQ